MAGKFRNETTAASAENGDDLYKKLYEAVYNERTSSEKKMQIRLMCGWGFSEKLIKYLMSRITNFSIRDLDFIRICCIFIPEEKVEIFCKKHFNVDEFTYETIIDELADEHIRLRMPDFSFDELKSLKEKNDSLKASLGLHKQYLELLKDQASLARAEIEKADNSIAEEIARWKEKAEALTAEIQTAKGSVDGLEEKLAATEKAEREWKEKAENARIELERNADEIARLKIHAEELEDKERQNGSKNNAYTAQIVQSLQKAIVYMEGMEKSSDQYYMKIMGKLGEIQEAQKQFRRKSGTFISLFGSRNEPKKEEDHQTAKDPNSEKQAFITEIMSDKGFNERHYAVLGYLLDKLPVNELREIANPSYDDKRLKFISDWYCRSHGITFDFNSVVSSSNDEKKKEAYEDIQENDEDEVITSVEDDDD